MCHFRSTADLSVLIDSGLRSHEERSRPFLGTTQSLISPGILSYMTMILSHRVHLLKRFRKSTSPQNRQLIVYYHSSRYSVEGSIGELTS